MMCTKTVNWVISGHAFTDACNFLHECRIDPEWDTRQSGKPVCCKSSERNVPHMGNQSEIKMALVCKPSGLALQAATTIIKF